MLESVVITPLKGETLGELSERVRTAYDQGAKEIQVDCGLYKYFAFAVAAGSNDHKHSFPTRIIDLCFKSRGLPGGEYGAGFFPDGRCFYTYKPRTL